MDFDKAELLRLVFEQAVTIRNLKQRIRLLEGTYFPDEDFEKVTAVVDAAMSLVSAGETTMPPL